MKALAYCYTCKKDLLHRIVKFMLGVDEIKIHIKCPNCKKDDIRHFETK